MPEFTFITTCYQQPIMLRHQLIEWNQYPPEVSVLLVDDCSPEPALPIVLQQASESLRPRLRVYRILEDIAWNRNECRNLAGQEAQTVWCVFADIDHLLPVGHARALVDFPPTPGTWYRFSRWRVGAADATRRKDAIPDDCTFGQVKPHGDSFLIERELFLRYPYDLAYSGMLGGGTPFQKRLEAAAPVDLLPPSICLYVYTRHVIPDASVLGLSRDTGPYARLRRQKEARGDTIPTVLVKRPWERVL